jgi:hypothetical protein
MSGASNTIPRFLCQMLTSINFYFRQVFIIKLHVFPGDR